MRALLIKVITITTTSAILLGGCSAPASQSETQVETTTTEETTVPETTIPETTIPPTTVDPDSLLKVIGTEQAGAGIYRLKLTNKTGGVIQSIRIKSDVEPEYGESISGSEEFTLEETRILYYDSNTIPETTVEESLESEGAETEAEEIISMGYSVLLSMADGAEYELHGFPFGDIAEGEIHVSDNVAYLTYVSLNSGQPVDTKESELATAQKAEEARRAEEERLAEESRQAEEARLAEESRQAEESKKAAEKAKKSSSSSSSGSSSKKSSGSSSKKSSGSSSKKSSKKSDSGSQGGSSSNDVDDGCVGEGALFY